MDRYPYHWYTILLGATRALAHIGVYFTHHVFGLSVRIADGSFSPIVGKGEIALTLTLTLNSVLHVPKLCCNLFSVSKFTQTNNCVAKFFPSYCEFQDLGSGKTIGSAREIKGSYYFDDGAIRDEQVQVAKKVLSMSDEIRL